MKKHCNKILITVFTLTGIIALFGAFNVFSSLAAEDQVEIKLGVTGCNNNNVCEGFEDSSNCLTDCPVTAPTPPGENGPPAPSGARVSTPIIYNLAVTNLVVAADTVSVLISWETSKHALSKIFWGKTIDYEEGSLSEVTHATEHSTKIVNLTPGAKYYFKIEITDSFGNKNSLDKQFFETLPLPDMEPPANVSGLNTELKDGLITLGWQNPPDKDFESVRVLRSDKFYPEDPFDGELVYEGSGREATTPVQKGVTYYYTIFSRDKSGNYSSGAIASVKIPAEGAPAPDVAGTGVKPPAKDIFAEFPQALEAHPMIKELSLLDFDFIQDDKKISFSQNTVPIKGGENLKISLDYDKIPEVLKTIAITLNNQEGQSFSFLLRVNKDKTAYEALIAPFEMSGDYTLNVSILDFKNQGLKSLSGALLVSAIEKVGKGAAGRIENSNIFLIVVILLAIIVPALAIIIRLAVKKDSIIKIYE